VHVGDAQQATVEDVGRIYRAAWHHGAMGITVYRYGSRPRLRVLTPHAAFPKPGSVTPPIPAATGPAIYGP
jgi:hypothetical protein